MTQTKGLRLGGAILVPTLVVYALKDFTALPVFVASTAVAYGLLWLAKQRTLVYGRDEFLVALAAGTLVPFGGYLLVLALWPRLLDVNPLLFVGSILPGLAAYNLAQTKPEYRRQDLVYTAALVAALVGLGALLVDPWLAGRLGGRTPPILFARTADIAVLRDAVVARRVVPDLAIRPVVVGFLLVGMALSEVVRREFGIRVGVISMALLALFALVSRWLLVLFVLAWGVSLAATWAVHRSTLLYGRVLLSLGCGAGTLAALALVGPLPVERGFSALFVGVIAGVDAYAVHATPPRERRVQPFLLVAVFVLMLGLMRSAIRPFERGVLQQFTPVHVLVGAAVVAGSLAVAYRWRRRPPDDEAVLSASVLSGGDA